MKKSIFTFAIILLLINGVSAFYGGYLLMIDPTGNRLHLPGEWLAHTSFSDFFIPGIILFIVNGILSFAVITSIVIKSYHASAFIFIEGSLLMGWIIMQFALTKMYTPLQVIMACIGLLLIASGIILMKAENKIFTRS